MKIIMFNKRTILFGSTNMTPSHCLCKKFYMSKIRYEETEEVKMKRGEDEEERMTLCFGNNNGKH